MAGSMESGEFGLQIAPMLDVLFVLLLFFMVSASIQKKEGELKTPLPGGGAPSNGILITVKIDSDDGISVNGAAMDSGASGHNLPQLTARLQGIISINPDQPVVVSPSRSTKQQRVVDVLNACKGAQVKKLALGAAL